MKKFEKLCESTIAPEKVGQDLRDFGLEFCDKDRIAMLTIPVVPTQYGSPRGRNDGHGKNYLKPCSIPSINGGYTTSPALIEDGITIMPEFFSLSNGGGGEFSRGFNYCTKPILVTHLYKISPDILKETQSLRLIPKRYGVIEKSLPRP